MIAGFAAVPQAFANEDKKYHDYDDEETTTEQYIAQLSAEIVAAEGNVSNVSQDIAQIAEQLASGDENTTQEILQASAEIVASGGNVEDVEQSTAQVASQSSGEPEEDDDEEEE
jgi:hypothetical protein